VKIKLLIPARNEAERIGEVITKARPFVDTILVIDDASEDATGEVSISAGARVIRNEKRMGYLGSIRRGFREADADIVVTIDADGEYSPADIPKLVEPIKQGKADVVFGIRPEIPRFSERLLNRLVAPFSGIPDNGSGFRALKGSLAKKLKLRGKCTCGTFVIECLMHRARICGVPVRIQRAAKRRNVAWWHLVQLVYVTWLLLQLARTRISK
jgi:glycosyltransferase involved in cell wall biosynthesis